MKTAHDACRTLVWAAVLALGFMTGCNGGGTSGEDGDADAGEDVGTEAEGDPVTEAEEDTESEPELAEPAVNATHIFEIGELGTGDGAFDEVGDIAVDSAGNIYACDMQNDRV